MSAATWPPEVPPFRPTPPPGPQPQPQPILPSWYERDVRTQGDILADRLLEQRIVLATGRLDASLGERLTAQLLLLDSQGADPVQLHLASPDGDLDASLALADALQLLDAPVVATVRGTLGGAAVAVLGAVRDRVGHHAATIVLREPVTADAGQGRADELAVRAEQHRRQVARLVDLLATSTVRDAAGVQDDLRRGRVLSAEDAVAYGLLDRIR